MKLNVMRYEYGNSIILSFTRCKIANSDASRSSQQVCKQRYSKDKIIETKCLVLSDSCQNIDETERNEI